MTTLPSVTDRDSHCSRIRSMVDKYSSDFPTHVPGTLSVDGDIVALSGATGNVGSIMLSMLLGMDGVKRVYLLNRFCRQNPESRIANTLKEKGFDPSVLYRERERIVYLAVDFSNPNLGLSKVDYEDLKCHVTHIIHSAWDLNFKNPLEGFESIHIAGVRHLINLTLASPQPKPPRLVFLSSLAGAGSYKGPFEQPSIGEIVGQCLVPELPIDDPTMAWANHGYGMSKYVAERIVVNAANAGVGLRATISRVGMLSGTLDGGPWAKDETAPILLQTIMATGICPDDLPSYRFTPYDIAASALLKQTFHDSTCLQYFSIENPFPTPWKNFKTALFAMSPKPLEVVSWADFTNLSSRRSRGIRLGKVFDSLRIMIDGFSETAALGWNHSVEIAPELATGPLSIPLVYKYLAKL